MQHDDLQLLRASSCCLPLPVYLFRYKTVILQEPLPEEGIQAVLDYASSGERGSRVFEFQARCCELARLLYSAAGVWLWSIGSEVWLSPATLKRAGSASPA